MSIMDSPSPKAIDWETRETVQVFKTTVDDERVTIRIIQELQRLFPGSKINFDLEDCDRILRIDPCGIAVSIDRVRSVVVESGHQIEPL
jgi:hypothetical protein